MADHLRLDPEALRKLISDVRSTGTDMEGKVSALESVLTDHDGCWGDDDIGKGFAKNYVDNANEVRGYNREAADGFGNYADNAEQIGEQFLALSYENANSTEQAYYDNEFANDLKNPPPQQ